MDNITHSLTGGVLAQMGLKRQSRFAFAACLLGANAPDIDIFAPLVLPVDGIAFHRGPVHSLFAVPLLAAALTGLLWLIDRLWPRPGRVLRPAPLFLVALAATATHPFLDWLTTYAIAIFSPLNWRWYSADAIFIVDWVYWLLMIGGIAGSWWRGRRGAPSPGRPAQAAGLLLVAYIGFNMGLSASIERATAELLRRSNVEARLVVAGPPPFAFWRRDIHWRSSDLWGSGSYDLTSGLRLDPETHRIGLDDPRLARAARDSRYVRSFLSWSRMPIVISDGGHTYLTDQRFHGPLRSRALPSGVRSFFRRHAFQVPLD